MTAEDRNAARLVEEAFVAYERGDYATALEIVRPLAEQGDARAQGLLGVMYGLGHGVPQDYGQAWDWLYPGAEAGDVNAQYNFGSLYDRGLAVRRDHKEAEMWYRRAAHQNAALAQYSLGVYYDEGLGVPQDHVLAYMWHHIAASTTFEDYIRVMAVRERRLVAGKLSRAQIAKARRLARKWMSEHPAPWKREPARIEPRSVLTCPHCGHRTEEEMPADACLLSYRCAACGTLLQRKPGDCCVFCSYGSVPCPPVQAGARRHGNAGTALENSGNHH